MLWNQQEIGAHTGVGEETPPPPPPPPHKKLDNKLVPDRSQEYKYNLNY